jgi:hypothetical protein
MTFPHLQVSVLYRQAKKPAFCILALRSLRDEKLKYKSTRSSPVATATGQAVLYNLVGSNPSIDKLSNTKETDRKAFMICRVRHERNFSMDFALIIKGNRAKAMEKFCSYRTR